MNSPLPGPPLSRPPAWLSICHTPGNRIRGFFGFIGRSEQPVFWSTKSVRAHVWPRPVLGNTPRSCCGAGVVDERIARHAAYGVRAIALGADVAEAQASVHVRTGSGGLSLCEQSGAERQRGKNDRKLLQHIDDLYGKSGRECAVRYAP